MTRVVLTGDRHWTDAECIRCVLTALKAELGRFVLIQGGATGADQCARRLADDLGLACLTVTADWGKYGRAAGPRRNREMLDFHPAVVLAFHDDLSRSKGTRDCVDEALRRSIPVRVHSHGRWTGWRARDWNTLSQV